MRLTPLDLRRAQFSAAVRGFNRTEVTSFLSEAADDLELALSTAERARHEVTALHAQLAEHRRSESPARDTVLAAMRHRRREAEESLEGAIARMRSALDEVRRPDPGLRPPDNVREHHPRPTTTATAASGTDGGIVRRISAAGPGSSA